MTAPTTGVASRDSRLATFSTPTAVALAIVSAVVVASVVDTIVAAIAHAAGAPSGFRPLQFGTFTSLTVIGVVVGALAWTLIRRRSSAPATLLRRLVPIVVVLSFVPDIIVGAGKSQPHTTWGGVAALMVMHLVVAGAAVTAFALLLPVRDTSASRAAG